MNSLKRLYNAVRRFVTRAPDTHRRHQAISMRATIICESNIRDAARLVSIQKLINANYACKTNPAVAGQFFTSVPSLLNFINTGNF